MGRRTLMAAGIALAAIAVTAATAPAFPKHMFHVEGPPVGHTGGFTETTCQTCHAEFDLNPSVGAWGIDGFPAIYHPGERYTVTLSVLGDDMVVAGFQAAIRFATGPNTSSSAGRIEPLDQSVRVARAGDTGVDYVQHTDAGSRVVADGVASWQFIWTAPRDTSRVALNFAANDGNGDNSPLGDYVYAGEVVSNGLPSDIDSARLPR